MHRVMVLVAACATVSPVLAIDLPGAKTAAVDQPRVNLAMSRPGGPVLTGQSLFGGESIQVQAFYDTGASGVVIGEATMDVLGVQRQTLNGERVVFGDVSPTGVINFNVSEPLVLYTADALGFPDQADERAEQLSDPDLFPGNLYRQATQTVRTQIGPVGSGVGIPGIGEINVVGVPAMQGQVLTFDARPTNGYLDAYIALLDGEELTAEQLDIQMRTSTHRPGTNFYANRASPGIPPADVTIQTTLVDFDRYTQITPGGIRPDSRANPMIGPSPIDGSGDAPPVRIKLGDQSSDGSWLFDTGAAASFVSSDTAADLGVTYADDAGIGSDNPLLEGVPMDRQFSLTISGIGGVPTQIAGFFADELLLRTAEGDAADPDDPNHVNFMGAPVLVLDIVLEDPDTGVPITLDGILGMNYFVASVDTEIGSDIFPILTDFAEAPVDFFTYDARDGSIGLTFDAPDLPLVDLNPGGGLGGQVPIDFASLLPGSIQASAMVTRGGVVPEPATLSLLLAGGALLLRRRWV